MTMTSKRRDLVDYSVGVLNRFLRSYGTKLVAMFLWLTIFFLARTYMLQNKLSVMALANKLLDFITSSPSAPFIYLVFASARPFLLIPATIITMIAGSAFGLRNGFIYATIGSIISAVFPYIAGHFLSGKQTGKRPNGILKYAHYIKKQPFQSTLILRLLYLPFDPISYVAGLAGADFTGFMLATLLGNVVSTLSFVAIGASWEGISQEGVPMFNIQTLLLSLVLIFTSFAVSRVLKQKNILQKNRVE